ncbi:UNVERIFIED_CONTAM: hypothetical protein RMT77_017656 [Armadillidium vulgare]
MLGPPSGLSLAMDNPRSRRNLLQRSDTAPEEMELERRLEAEWRRRTFGRANSADRPSSVNASRTSFTLPAAFSGKELLMGENLIPKFTLFLIHNTYYLFKYLQSKILMYSFREILNLN